MKLIISSTLMMAGLVLMAGSANDCGGDCMEQANTIGEMLMYAGAGLAMFATGALMAIAGDQQ